MSPQKRAFITGYTGQDGTFLTELLLSKGYQVIGLVRRVSTEPPVRVRGRFDFSEAMRDGNLILVEGDLLSTESLINIIQEYKPDEIYNLAAQSHVGVSFKQPEITINTDLIGVVNLVTALNSIKLNGPNYKWKLYQASTSEMFGDRPAGGSMDENVSFSPNSPYAIAKAAAHFYIRSLRNQGYFTCAGILFNHESEIRGQDFVTQKIAAKVAEFKLWVLMQGSPERGLRPVLELGNIESKRDWGYAGDYVKAMWLMMQRSKPDEYVIGTGQVRSVKEFVEEALSIVDLEINWEYKEGAYPVGLVNGHQFVVVNPKYFRPAEVNYLHADCSKANKILNWYPQVSFQDMVEKMVNAQMGIERLEAGDGNKKA
jgi:GDPmannose 4,6-dehydratase